MQNDILFDNIYIGHSVEDAEKFKAETFDIKHAIEKKEEDAEEPEPEKKAKSPMDLKFLDNPVHYIREKLDLFMTIAKNDPIQAAKFVPEVAAGLGVVALTVIATLVGILSMGASTPQGKKVVAKTKETVAEKKDQVVDAASSGAQKVEAEVQKRTTRSSAAQQQAEI